VVVGAVATVVLAAGAVTTGVLYNDKLHDYNTANDQLAANRFDLRSQTKTLGIANLALVGGTVVAAGVTIVLWRRASSSAAASETAAPRVALGATTAPGLAALNVSGSF
jgi:hypothetical protein